MYYLILACVVALATCSPRRGECPRECVCEDAPLRSASFVLTWMTSWGEDDLPEIHPNEATMAGDSVQSTTALDAGVDVDVLGLHATCAVMAGSNLTSLLHGLPPRTMVLSVMQAAGEELVVVEAQHLAPLTHLRALHLQGYATHGTRQVSGHTPNRVLAMVELKEKARDAEDAGGQDLILALSEDALTSLTQLQLLDLQYVRLVAAMEGGRPRRQTQPLYTTTLLDMPLQDFLAAVDQIPDLDLPPELSANASTPHQDEEEVVFVPLDSEDENVVPYEVFRAEHEAVLAPFRTQSELRYLRVAQAKLDRVGPELLTGLTNLHTLTLEHNHIKVLPPAMFTPTTNLRHLSLAHNNILSLEGESLAGLDNLLTLDLDSNKLDSLGPSSFPRLPIVATIRLLDNPLSHVFPFTFANVNSTEQLYLGSRHISAEIHTDTFRQLSSLSALQLENTTLLSLSRRLLDGMPNLKDLTLHGQISYIDYDAFTNSPNLESLTLSHCHLEKLSLDAFFGLKKLRNLDLSHNNLDDLVPGIFDHLSSLRELYLHHNNLTTLPLAIFVPTPVKLVQLHHNPWDCTCNLMQLRPALTNKVRRPTSTTCRWEEKFGTVCTPDDPPRLRYDARVAPLCHTPHHFRYNDVFKVTHRRLKCPKNLWDPRPNKHRKTAKKVVKEPVVVVVQEVVEVDEPNWLPLTAFSDIPKEVKDLLDIAEAEMPEEAFAPLTEEEMEENDWAERGESEETEEEEERENENERPQQDQAAIPIANAPSSITEYRRQKDMMKKQMEEERRRAAEIKLREKHELKMRLTEEKKKTKAKMLLQEELAQQRKVQEMIAFMRTQETEGSLLNRMM